ncbi:uncharacterized protein CC84DRAFT_899941 [Paraphaeosphaeria sporulosa]|uniref:PLAT domain-containing protein n=1 Tax=Paraphaeosphaeria sporulosa TaxID=1460663 RepID=A0A177C592_9PLEO|nr:uncharacterized protein CC84DRAFT_899941 [Paraphaeosphaeria sporulosa]OAG02606.1 hypothetical protein CC84DRAFT_899941 [Paraphaeosphaeria sporulosa]
MHENVHTMGFRSSLPVIDDRELQHMPIRSRSACDLWSAWTSTATAFIAPDRNEPFVVTRNSHQQMLTYETKLETRKSHTIFSGTTKNMVLCVYGSS